MGGYRGESCSRETKVLQMRGEPESLAQSHRTSRSQPISPAGKADWRLNQPAALIGLHIMGQGMDRLLRTIMIGITGSVSHDFEKIYACEG
jgi:hypothetical protein